MTCNGHVDGWCVRVRHFALFVCRQQLLAGSHKMRGLVDEGMGMRLTAKVANWWTSPYNRPCSKAVAAYALFVLGWSLASVCWPSLNL